MWVSPFSSSNTRWNGFILGKRYIWITWTWRYWKLFSSNSNWIFGKNLDNLSFLRLVAHYVLELSGKNIFLGLRRRRLAWSWRYKRLPSSKRSRIFQAKSTKSIVHCMRSFSFRMHYWFSFCAIIHVGMQSWLKTNDWR